MTRLNQNLGIDMVSHDKYMASRPASADSSRSCDQVGASGYEPTYPNDSPLNSCREEDDEETMAAYAAAEEAARPRSPSPLAGSQGAAAMEEASSK